MLTTTSLFSSQYVRLPLPPLGIDKPSLQRTLLTTPSSQTFSSIAQTYDEDLYRPEKILGIPKLRKRLLSQIKSGSVLEVSCGTGINLNHYPFVKKSSSSVKSTPSSSPPGLSHLILTDASDSMLDVAISKFESSTELKELLQVNDTRLGWRKEIGESLSFPSESFDYVVDTFGLCSHEDPLLVLKEMSRVLKPNGKLLLLEHGKSNQFPWLTTILNRTALSHAQRWGCWWNRDIVRLVIEADLKVESLEMNHFGTTYTIVASKPTL